MSRQVAKGISASATVAVVLAVLAVPASASSAGEWSGAYCRSVEKYTAAIETAGNEATTAARDLSTATELSTIVGVLDEGMANIRKRADAVLKSVEKVGAPDIKNGAKVQKGALAAFKEARDLAKSGQASLKGIDTSDVTNTGPLLDAMGAAADAAHATNQFQLNTLYNAVKKDKAFATAFGKACS